MPDLERTCAATNEDDAFATQLNHYGRVVFSPVGGSMYPMLRDARDVVVLVRPEGAVKPLDVALYRDDRGRYVLHRIVSVAGDRVVLRGDGRLLPDPPVNCDRIIAVMTGFYRGDRFIAVHSHAYRLYARLWHALRRWRRFLLRACDCALKIRALITKEMRCA